MDQIRVLLVEDDLCTCALMEAYFRNHGLITICGVAHDGEQGLKLIRQLEPDLVLLDLIMPRRSGIGVIDDLRENPPPSPPKIFVISQVSNQDTIQNVLARNVSYYLMKPVDYSEIVRVIKLLFEPFPIPANETRLSYQLLLQMGGVEHDLGFRYAAETAETLSVYTAQRKMLLKEAYHPIIKSERTNYSCVEKNIRATVRKMHLAKTETYQLLMGGQPEAPPSNSIFLRRLAERLRQLTQCGGGN